MKIHDFPDDEKSKKYKIVHFGKSISTITQHTCRFILCARARFEGKTKYFKKFLNARHPYGGRSERVRNILTDFLKGLRAKCVHKVSEYGLYLGKHAAHSEIS